ncbi:hypothetical protein ACFQU7_14135 [Pseudoroseomonas wenyumeiae]
MTTETPRRATTRFSRVAASLLVLGGLAACAPVYTNTTYAPYAVGRAASVSYGTIVGLRPVTVQGGQPGSAPPPARWRAASPAASSAATGAPTCWPGSAAR